MTSASPSAKKSFTPQRSLTTTGVPAAAASAAAIPKLSPADGRAGEAVPAHDDPVGGDARRHDVIPLDSGRDHDRRRSRGDTPRDRGIKGFLDPHFAQSGLEHAQGLEYVRDTARPRPPRRRGRDDVAEAEQVYDVRPRQPD